MRTREEVVSGPGPGLGRARADDLASTAPHGRFGARQQPRQWHRYLDDEASRVPAPLYRSAKLATRRGLDHPRAEASTLRRTRDGRPTDLDPVQAQQPVLPLPTARAPTHLDPPAGAG